MSEEGGKFDEIPKGDRSDLAEGFFATGETVGRNDFPAYQMPEKVLVNGQEFLVEDVFDASPFSSPEFAMLTAEDQKAVVGIVEDTAVICETAEAGVPAAQSFALANEFLAVEIPDNLKGKTGEEKESLVSHAIAWMSKFGRQLTVAGLLGVAMLAPMKSVQAQNSGGEVAVATAEASAQRAQVNVRAAQIKENFKKIQSPTETQIAQYDADMARVKADIARIDSQLGGMQGRGAYQAGQERMQQVYVEGQQGVEYRQIAGQIQRMELEKIQSLANIDAQIRQLQINGAQVLNQGAQQVVGARGWGQVLGAVLQGGQGEAQIYAQINNLQMEKGKVAAYFDTQISSFKVRLTQLEQQRTLQQQQSIPQR